MKSCASCGLDKPKEQFHKKTKTKDGLHNYCKECTAAKNKVWALANTERRKTNAAVYYTENKEKLNRGSTEWHYRHNYGITYNDFLIMAKGQDNQCKICKQPLSFAKDKTSNKAVLDHCHASGKLRGVLCLNCNSALGKLKDSVESLESAILYLKESV